MAVEGGMKCVKYLMFFFNFLFWLAGLALIVIGIVVLVKLNKSSINMEDLGGTGAPIVIIAVGVIIFFISFFGCCGAWKENYCMVTTFAVLLTLIFLVEIAAAIAGYIFKDRVTGIFKTGFEEGMSNYTTNEESKKVIDGLQIEFKCCGSTNSSSWAIYWKNSSVPDSCCVNVTQDCGKVVKPSSINTDGCVGKIDKWIKDNIIIVAGVALGIAFFQLLGIVFACMLMKGIRSGYEVM